MAKHSFVYRVFYGGDELNDLIECIKVFFLSLFINGLSDDTRNMSANVFGKGTGTGTNIEISSTSRCFVVL